MPDRNTGSFYTLKSFADFAHSVISKHFGDNWKSRYIVWDSAWDCGCYRQKRMFEVMDPERFKEFRKRYKDLGMKLRGQVY